MMKRELTFEPDGHKYFLAGAELPSVTRVLADMGFVDTSFFTPGSAQRGTYVHFACELDDIGELMEETLDPALLPYLYAWRAFKQDSMFAADKIEHRVCSEMYRFAGTVDRVGKLNGHDAIIDIKSGAVLPVTALQIAGYEIAISKKHRPYKRYAVQLKDDGTYRVHPFTDPQDRHIFLAAVSCWHWQNNHNKRR